MKKGLSLILFLLLATNVKSQGIINSDAVSKTIVTSTDSFLIQEQVNLDIGSKKEYIITQFSTIGESPVMIRTLIYTAGILREETVFKDGKPYFTNRFSNKMGRISLSCGYLFDSVKEAEHSINELYRVNGIVNFYSKRGKLEISAIYSKGEFKEVLYYRNNRILRKFLETENIDDPTAYHIGTNKY